MGTVDKLTDCIGASTHVGDIRSISFFHDCSKAKLKLSLRNDTTRSRLFSVDKIGNSEMVGLCGARLLRRDDKRRENNFFSRGNLLEGRVYRRSEESSLRRFGSNQVTSLPVASLRFALIFVTFRLNTDNFEMRVISYMNVSYSASSYDERVMERRKILPAPGFELYVYDSVIFENLPSFCVLNFAAHFSIVNAARGRRIHFSARWCTISLSPS
ncbi:hypothetical protein ANN_04807 [Periplaneta americana]|uniref:Uncharacterized protein n=1 Tax=Periplaneta americana TaxID=6978 RepID=A0ABQ8T9C9_PERAM|nr:hypothetical protein ANN_04807 [Periplaneta americana]